MPMQVKPKKTVLILGNGFDLDAGRKTRYKDFCESELCPKKYPAPLMKYLNESWSENVLDSLRWYDLEKALFNYGTVASKTIPDFFEPYLMDYIRDFDPYEYTNRSYISIDKEMTELVSFGYAEFGVTRQWAKIHYLDDFRLSIEERDKKAVELIKEKLCEYLKIEENRQLEKKGGAYIVLNALARTSTPISIYNFNYTQLPWDFDWDFSGAIHYVHGNCKMRNIILGAKESLDYPDKYRFVQKIGAPEFRHTDIIDDLYDAKEVIIFGHSLGDNDHDYFRDFFKEQASRHGDSRAKITIFTFDDHSEGLLKREIQEMGAPFTQLSQLRIIKTENLKTNSVPLREFLENYIADPREVRQLLGKLNK